MNPTDELQAASTHLRTRNTPLNTAIADWLDHTTNQLQIRLNLWNQTYEPPGVTETIEANTAVLYAHPLNIARAALAEHVTDDAKMSPECPQAALAVLA